MNVSSPTSCRTTRVKARRGLSASRPGGRSRARSPARPGDDHREPDHGRRFPARCAPAHRRRARRRGGGVAAVVDLGDRSPDRALAAGDAADPERRGAAPGGRVGAGRPAGAARDLCGRGHGLGGCPDRRALPWRGIVPAADHDPGAVRAVSPLRSRAVGRRRVPGVGHRAARQLLCDDQLARRVDTRDAAMGFR